MLLNVRKDSTETSCHIMYVTKIMKNLLLVDKITPNKIICLKFYHFWFIERQDDKESTSQRPK